ncbi:MFS drug transporter [Paecilomyces variotii No. 5]|uniref:MFS drug transporter n=1 Tax=Byssochlamys spectabilis (strain No. 5 / NBRC 109023) TaxID=1356009 RepID=V5FRP6_BYSSN|nr:MFS drug transporter [Paecilomyces variotii No. 5]
MGGPSASPQAGAANNAITFNEQTRYVTRGKIITIFLACASVDLLALMDQTTLAASLAIIGSSLHAGSQTSWISNGYFITSTSFQLLYGRFSDIWSRKFVLLTGLFIFFIGSLASSVSNTAPQLIAFRAITGVGGGGLMTIAQIIVSDVVSLRDRGKYQGILGAVVALANGIGPVIGGALASISEDSWQVEPRWIFRLNMPLTAFTTLCVIFVMPLRPVQGSWKKKLKAIDFLGVILTLSASTLIVLGLTWAGGDYQWKSVHVIVTLVIGGVLWVLFFLWEWKGHPLPLIPLHIFKSRIVNGACLTMFVNGWNFVVQVYYIPTFYQLLYGYSAVKSATLLLPITLIQTFSSTLSGLIVTWTGRYRENLLFGWICWAVGLGLYSTLDSSSSLGKQVGYGVLTGFGVGQTLQPSLVAIQAGVSRKDMAVVTGARNFIRNLGGTIGLAIAGTIINNSLRSAFSTVNFHVSETEVNSIINDPLSFLSEKDGTDQNSAAIRDALIDGYKRGFQAMFWVMAGLAGLAFLIAFFLMPQLTLDRADDKKLKEEAKAELKKEAEDKKTKAEKAEKKDEGEPAPVMNVEEVTEK